MTLIDSHAHYENKRYDQDRHQLLQELPQKGVELIINVGCDFWCSQASIELAEQYPHVYATVGIHPHYAKVLDEEKLVQLKSWCAHPKVVALGETGLDFYHDFSPRDVQRHWFKRQLELAAEVDIPVAIHSRDANDEVFKFISDSTVRTGVIHSFSSDAAFALAYVQMGFHIGISGVVTFDKTDTLKDAVAAIPLTRILMETDAPYLTPVPYRGKRNESQYLSYVAETIADIKGVTVEEVCRQTSANVREVFPKIK